MKLKDDERENALELAFVLPFGVEASIFPWGIHSIKEYIDKTTEHISTKIISFQNDPYFTKFVVKHKILLNKLVLLLEPQQMPCFYNVNINPYNFVGAVAYCGRDFLKQVDNKIPLTNEEYDELDQIKNEVETHILKKLKDNASIDTNMPRIWAFSVYDGTLFNSLYIARLIKKLDSASPIIFGGDYFDFGSAEKLVREVSYIEAVIVGYGEEVLRKICTAMSHGFHICNQQINGLVNSYYLKNEDKENICKKVTIPPFYYDLPRKPTISYVKQSESGVLHVITQRGCSWGKCSFCTQIDRCSLFLISSDELIDEIFAIVKLSNLRKVIISFDSEEVSCEFVMALLKQIQRNAHLDIIFQMNIWFQVKSFKKNIIDQLLELDIAKVSITFRMNFESLNNKTLIRMKKGHTPLKAIEAAKSIVDCGQTYYTNYFIEFPLENSISISQEISLLEKVIHLLTHQNGNISLIRYTANNRDDIYNNQNEYNVIVNRNPKDRLLKKTFGVDLPYSYWTYEYKHKFNYSFDFVLNYLYNRIISCRFKLDIPPVIVKQFFMDNVLIFRRKLTYRLDKAKLSVLTGILRILAIFKNGKVYQRRLDIFLYLRSSLNTKQNEQGCSFQLIGDRLVKDYNFLGIQDKWTLPLNDIDIKILRYLYWTRKLNDVYEKFKSDKNEQEITRFINNHIELGTIIKYEDLMLCVVNDPEYWIRSEDSVAAGSRWVLPKIQ